MFHQFKDYFQFSKAERKGVIALVIVIILLIITKQSLVYLSPEISYRIQTLDSLTAQLEQLKEAEELNQKTKRAKPQKIEVADFDPNNYRLSDWEKLGLSKKQAQVIKNYQAKAGNFESKQSIKKMFVISDELYERIEPHLLLPDSMAPRNIEKNTKQFTKKWENKPRVLPKIEINTADTAEYRMLSGIGKVLSARIVKYRGELGGFQSKDQLKEVWGLSEETLARLDSQLLFTAVQLKKVSINNATVDELKAHPYIRWKIANSIVKYREQHGLYLQIEDLKKSVLITDSIYNRIIPYLEL